MLRSHKWLYHVDACAGSVLTPRDHITPTCRKDLVTESGWEAASAAAVVPSWTLSWSTQKPAATQKPREDTTHVFTLWCAA